MDDEKHLPNKPKMMCNIKARVQHVEFCSLCVVF